MKKGIALVWALAISAASSASDDKPVALCGFPTDVRAVASDVMKPGRYVFETFENKWIEPSEYGRYSVIYFGEKIDGEAKGKSFRRGEADEARAALETFLSGGGVVIVGGEWCMRQLFGWPDRKDPDPLRSKVINIPKCIGRTKVTYAKEGRSLGYADDAGNFVVSPEGQEVQNLTKKYADAFALAKNARRVALEGVWDPTPLGKPGTLKHATRFAKRAEFRKPPARRPGLTILGGGQKAVIVVPPDLANDCRRLADELAWHLEKMSGERFAVVDA